MGTPWAGCEIGNRDSACLHAFGNIAAHWNMSVSEQCLLLGVDDDEILHDWMKRARAGDNVSLPKDILEGIGCVLSIYASLVILLNHDRWLGACAQSCSAISRQVRDVADGERKSQGPGRCRSVLAERTLQMIGHLHARRLPPSRCGVSVRNEDFIHHCASSIRTRIRCRFAGLDHPATACLPRHASSSRDRDQRSQEPLCRWKVHPHIRNRHPARGDCRRCGRRNPPHPILARRRTRTQLMTHQAICFIRPQGSRVSPTRTTGTWG